MYIPGEISAGDPSDICQSLAKGASLQGITTDIEVLGNGRQSSGMNITICRPCTISATSQLLHAYILLMCYFQSNTIHVTLVLLYFTHLCSKECTHLIIEQLMHSVSCISHAALVRVLLTILTSH